MSENNQAVNKHFNLGNVFGTVVDEVERKFSTNDKEYASFKVSVAGSKCGGAHAFCRLWGTEKIDAFVALLRRDVHAQFYFKGFFSQYWDDRNKVYSGFTVYMAEPRISEPRAAFVLRGVIKAISQHTVGDRMLLIVDRAGQAEETFELFSPNELLLDSPKDGDFVEVKGFIRQEIPENDYGESEGPVRAFNNELKIIAVAKSE